MMAVVPAVMATMMTPVVTSSMMAAAMSSTVAAPGPCCARKGNREHSNCCAYQSGLFHLSSFLIIGIDACRKRPEQSAARA
jgi:hypothetical protein